MSYCFLRSINSSTSNITNRVSKTIGCNRETMKIGRNCLLSLRMLASAYDLLSKSQF